MSRGIVSVGAYAPENRVAAEAFEDAWGRFDAPGVETKAVPDADEDALTMAVEAGLRALSASDEDNEIERVCFGSTTPPLAEEDLTPRLKSYLGLPSAVDGRTYTGSTRAGVDALLDATDSGKTTLVVAADCPESEPDDSREHAAGAGAVALIIGDGAPAEIIEQSSYSDVRPGTRFRNHGDADVDGLDMGTYDRAAFTDPVEAAVDGLDADSDAFDAVALQAPNGKLPYRAALDNGAIAAVRTVSELGDTAAASVPLSIATAFEEGYDRTLAVGWGSGAGATAFVIEGTAPVESSLEAGEEIGYPAYLRRRGDIVSEKPDGGAAHVPVPTWQRAVPQRHRHVSGECPECGAVVFPPEGACPSCLSLVEFDSVTPERTGTIDAATTIGQGGAPPEFAEQQAKQGAFGVAVVRFPAGDGEVSLPMQVVGETAVDETVRAVPRRVYVEEDVPRYGLKALPQ